MNKYFIFYFGVILSLMAQDDLLDLITEEPAAPVPVTATFKATRIVNSQSIELARPKTLEFMILHRFGSMKNGKLFVPLSQSSPWVHYITTPNQ